MPPPHPWRGLSGYACYSHTKWLPRLGMAILCIAIADRVNASEAIQLNIPAASDATVLVNSAGEEQTLKSIDGVATFELETDAAGQLVLARPEEGSPQLYHVSRSPLGNAKTFMIPLWLTILPPLVAIIAAFVFREVFVSLFLGVWTGTLIAGGLRFDSLYYLLRSPLTVIDQYVIQALNDTGHLSIIVFSLLIGGVVGLTIRNGGMAGISGLIARFARSARLSMLTTWFTGLCIFFDDYANTLIVGQTMRGTTDRFGVSREKLSYLVDSTAAPIAAVAFVSTWIGAELSYITDGISKLDGFDPNINAYTLFISSLKYSCYPLATLAFTFVVAASNRDFGPMLKVERAARGRSQHNGNEPTSPSPPSTAPPLRSTQPGGEGRGEGETNRLTNPSEAAEGNTPQLATKPGITPRSVNAIVPIFVLIATTLLGLIETSLSSFAADATPALVESHPNNHWQLGWNVIQEEVGADATLVVKLGQLLGRSDSYVALMWSSLAALIVAVLLTIPQRIMSLKECMESMLSGFSLMLPALTILTLAWALSATMDDLHTSTALTNLIGDSLHPRALPAIVFLLAAATSFVTGSSWSTMAILYPLVIPLSWSLSNSQNLDAAIGYELLVNTIAVTLSGAVLGDHCSPISDTTILSSMAAGCDHLSHVKTQLPYAILVGGVSVLFAGASAVIVGPMWVTLGLLAGFAGVAIVGFWWLSERVET